MGWLSSFFGFDDKPAAPTVVQQTSKIPEELAPYVKEILGEAQTLYAAQKERGYDPYTGETIAPLTPEELEAQEGLKGLVGTTTPYLQEALDIYRTGAEKFTPEAAQEYMSPYQRAVTDIEKREAQKVFERDIMPRFEKQAVAAGGMSGLGSRAGVQAGQLGQAQMQQMGDIEAKGLQKAYMDAQKLFAAQKARERGVATDIGRTGPAMLQAGLAEQGILQDIGQQKREMAQGALDEAYYKFLKEEAYPQDILASYSGTTYGASPFVSPGRSGTMTTTGGQQPYRQSPGQQLLGLGMQGLNIYGMGGGFGKGFDMANIWKKEGGGLSDLPVVRRQSGTYGRRKFLGRGRPTRKGSFGAMHPSIVEQQPEAVIEAVEGSNVPLDIIAKIRAEQERKRREEAEARAMGPTDTDIAFGLRDEFVSDKTAPSATGTKIPAKLTGTTGTDRLAQIKDAPANLRTTMRGLAEGVLKREEAKAPRGQRIEEAIALKSKDPKYDPAVQRQIGEATAAELEEANIASTAERTAIQEEGYTEESKAMTDYLAKQKKFIDEQGGYPGDIIAGAIQKGMEKKGIINLLSTTLGETAKGVGERSKEINKDLRQLNKDQFQMERELRKGKRTDKLANLEKKAARSLNKIATKANLAKEIAALPEKAQQAAMTQINAVFKSELTELQMSAKVIAILHDVVKADAAAKAAGVKGAGSPRSLTSYMDQIRKDIAQENNFVIDDKTGRIMVDDNTPLSKKQSDEISRQLQDRKDQFGKLLYKYDPSGTSTSALNQAYINLTPGKQSAPSDTPPARPQGVPSNTQLRRKDNKYVWVDNDSGKAWDSSGQQLP
jgi:hypothetical protein